MDFLTELSKPIEDCPFWSLVMCFVMVGAVLLLICILIIEEKNNKK